MSAGVIPAIDPMRACGGCGVAVEDRDGATRNISGGMPHKCWWESENGTELRIKYLEANAEIVRLRRKLDEACIELKEWYIRFPSRDPETAFKMMIEKCAKIAEEDMIPYSDPDNMRWGHRQYRSGWNQARHRIARKIRDEMS